MKTKPNPALNPVRFALWTLRDKAAQRRLALRQAPLLEQSKMLEMKQIAVPSQAPPYSRHVVKHGQCVGDTQKEVISKLLPEIQEELGKLINDFANDPDQCFLSDSYFPVKERLSGEYYIRSELYFMSKTDGQVILSLMVSCLEKQWHVSQEKDGTDYLGLEAFVIIDCRRQKFIFDDGFNTSSI